MDQTRRERVKMIKTEYGLRVAKKLKKLKKVDRKALVTAIVDELNEFGEKCRQYGVAGAHRKTSDKARVLMGLAYSEFLTGDGNYELAEEKRGIMLKVLGLDGFELVLDVERLMVK
jgi:hypothetical protein